MPAGERRAERVLQTLWERHVATHPLALHATGAAVGARPDCGVHQGAEGSGEAAGGPGAGGAKGGRPCVPAPCLVVRGMGRWAGLRPAPWEGKGEELKGPGTPLQQQEAWPNGLAPLGGFHESLALCRAVFSLPPYPRAIAVGCS